jgi:hypothetical protein
MLVRVLFLNPLNAELNPICHLLALLGAHHILHVGRIRVNLMLGLAAAAAVTTTTITALLIIIIIIISTTATLETVVFGCG